MATPRLPSAEALRRNKYVRAFVVGTLLIFSISVWFGGTLFLIRLTIISTLIMVGVALLRIAASLTSKPEIISSNMSDIDWPDYTVLVPLYDEANIVCDLVQCLGKLNYPLERLEIFLVCEADDVTTLDAIPADLKPHFQVIKVPVSQPRTKPKALNYALQFSKGSIVTIYDAEDRPSPNQLKTAALALKKHPEWGAVQAPLDYYNSSENWLTAQFTIEYAALFHVWLPFLARCGLPFPLGGTSNHIRASALRQTNGWDAFNVTEDADVSFRLAALGWGIGYIHSATEEEAVMRIRPWMSQRSRWMKGFIQTWLVHMARPLAPGGLPGLRRQFTLQLTIGATLMAGLFHVPSLLGFALAWALGATIIAKYFLVSMALCYACGMLIGGIGIIRAGKRDLMWHIPLMPFYWLLLFVPTLRALWEMGLRPFYWSKTAHGVKDAAL